MIHWKYVLVDERNTFDDERCMKILWEEKQTDCPSTVVG